MTLFRLIIRTLKHYLGTNLATAAGIAISTAVICGALIIGDSLRKSLLHVVDVRLGQITHTISAGERMFTRGFAENLDDIDGLAAAPALKSEAVVTVQGNDQRISKVQAWGVDSRFGMVLGAPDGFFEMGPGEAIISLNLATRLGLEPGDFFLMRIRRTGPIPPNTPFVSEGDQTISRRVKVKAIAGREDFGHFSLRSSQSAPLNLFVDFEWLNEMMNLENMANLVALDAGTAMMTSRITELIRQSWQPEDGHMKLEYQSSGRWRLTSERVFFENYLAERIEELFPESEFSLTYFVNELKHQDRVTPYSFVAAMDRSGYPLAPNETLINQWLADDLMAKTGDTLRMRYFEVGPLRELEEKEAVFIVKGILPMQQAEADGYLMPDLPGLSGAGSCSDWDTGIPINLDAIRPKDEQYWEVYKGAPKAYISLDRGRSLWENRFGNLTNVMIPGSPSNGRQIKERLSQHIDPFRMEFQVNPVREQGLEAARGGVDFGQLFAGLGMFIILAGLLLTVLLLNFSLEKRKTQLQLMASLGFPEKLIGKILITEALAVAALGALAGLVVSIGYSRLVFLGLNRIWHDIVRTDVLQLYYNPWMLVAGLIAGISLGMGVVLFGIRSMLKKSIRKAETGAQKGSSRGPERWLPLWLSVAFLTTSLLLAIYLGATSQFTQVLAWFLAGGILLTGLLLLAHTYLYLPMRVSSETLNLNRLSQKNLRRNPARSFTIIALLALGSFVIVVTAANRKDLATDALAPTGGTGGFLFMAETTAPVLRNLNATDTRLELGIPETASFVQFISVYNDDASCLNLNRVENPRILATDPEQLLGRFSFKALHPQANKQEPWASLKADLKGVIPAIADQSVIQWGLGKKLGDTLTYVNARGHEVRLLLIGGLANSVFQGNVIISSANFLEHFPSSGGSDVFLVEAPAPEEAALGQELGFIFRDHGWEMRSTRDKLAEFNSVENTYLGIFFLMGAFGMLLGTVGLAIILAKSMLERRSETALLRALGYPFQTLVRLFSSEYFLLFVAGMLAGTLAAILATLPTFLEGSQNIPSGFLALVLGVLFLNGAAWILIIPAAMIKRMLLTEALRNE